MLPVGEQQVRAHLPATMLGLNLMMMAHVRELVVHVGRQYINGMLVWQA